MSMVLVIFIWFGRINSFSYIPLKKRDQKVCWIHVLHLWNSRFVHLWIPFHSFFCDPSSSQAFSSQLISFMVRLINLDAAMPFDWQAELASSAAPEPTSRLKLPRLIAPHVRPPSAPSFAMVLTSTCPKRPMIHCHNPP